jgi:type II secretory pathway pseudopilin PulG
MKNSFFSSQGFHLIEILILFGIIGLVGTFASIAVLAARSQQRDTIRMAQIRQTQSALEDFFVLFNTYPQNDSLVLGGKEAGCLSENGFEAACLAQTKTFIQNIQPFVSKALKGQVVCVGEKNVACYKAMEEGRNYRIEFELENAWKLIGLVKGVNCAYPEGVRAGKCQ